MIIEYILGIILGLCLYSFIRYIVFGYCFCNYCGKYIPEKERLEFNNCCSSECYKEIWKSTVIGGRLK